MLMKLRRKLTNRKGQGMTEYIIIVALIAIAAIGVVTIFGDNIRALFGASVDALAGGSNANVATNNAGQSAGKRNLKNFANTGQTI